MENTSIIIAGILLILFLLAMLFYFYFRYKKLKALYPEPGVWKERQDTEIEHKNKEIAESIIYAKRIQNSILPSQEKLEEIFPDHFIYYKPKAIVSGDFYWVERRAKKNMFAVADCTGHGVPGVLMSIIGYDGLNRAIREYEITKSDKIMTALSDAVTETLRKTGAVDIKDGIEIALCVLNTENLELEYTGAKIPLYIIREEAGLTVNNKNIQPVAFTNQFNLFEIKPDRITIEPYEKGEKFSSHRIKLRKDDRVFIFTDGFMNQFGGASGRKFSYQSFRELLLKIQRASFREQKNQIELEFENWKGEQEQVDDILIMGIRI